MELGINLWPQNTPWPSMRERAVLADRLGFDSARGSRSRRDRLVMHESGL